MKNILLIYYTQTGQLEDIADSFLSFSKNNSEYCIDKKQIKPINNFPFPWTGYTFFDKFPECVNGESTEISIPEFDLNKKYDLIVLAYQAWFLSPSLPMISFLNSDIAKKIFQNQRVVTISGCRNMWLMAQERIKRYMDDFGAELVGNAAICDKAPNLVSLVTIIYWMFFGKKQKLWNIFPPSGVNQLQIDETAKYGDILKKAIDENQFKNLQQEFVRTKAVEVYPSLLVLEKRGFKIFKKFAGFIRSKGKLGDTKRKFRVKLFMYLLICGVFIVSPITALASLIIVALNRKNVQKEVDYFESVAYQRDKYR